VNTIHMRAEGVSYAYPEKLALDRVSVDIHPGEIVGLVGPNGSGKSTLIRCLSRGLVPQHGHIWIDDVDLARLSPRQVARRVAVVPQSFDVPPGFTAFEIVLMGRTPHLGWFEPEGERDRLIARRVMEQTGTWGLANSPADHLSGGERQRVIIARALAQEPQALLLDEPTAHLDVRHQVEVMELVRHLAEATGLAVLGVFHDLNLAAQYCQRLILLKEGHIYAAGDPWSVITADKLRAVYDVDLSILSHPVNHLPIAVVGKVG
jgi:iron complex transport system ATP-binding protein